MADSNIIYENHILIFNLNVEKSISSYTVPKKETSEFTKDMFQKVESPSMAEAVERAVKYLDTGEMPVYWEKSLLFSNTPTVESDSEDNFTDVIQVSVICRFFFNFLI